MGLDADVEPWLPVWDYDEVHIGAKDSNIDAMDESRLCFLSFCFAPYWYFSPPIAVYRKGRGLSEPQIR
jgi:hypothetical protein